MWSSFLIALSCLWVLYQSSLQGQSSQPSELLGFGSCDVERLLSCAREHRGLCCVCELWRMIAHPSQRVKCRPGGSYLSTPSSHRGWGVCPGAGIILRTSISHRCTLPLVAHLRNSPVLKLGTIQLFEHAFFKTRFRGSLKLPLVSGHWIPTPTPTPNTRAGLKKSNGLALFKGKWEELDSGS